MNIWYASKSNLPRFGEMVFLSKEPLDKLDYADVGRVIESDDGEQNGWLCKANGDVLKIEARAYWTSLTEKIMPVVAHVTDELYAPEVEQYLQKLNFYEYRFRRLSVAMFGPDNLLYRIDYYIAGIINRAMSLIYGFEQMLRGMNFIAAAHLARPHLDNYLRLFALTLVEHPNTFVNEVWSGKPVDKIKDRDGQLMKDFYLRDKAAETHPWITNVYKETSGFIHFSAKHIRNATTLSSEETPTLNTFIGKTDNNVHHESRLEAVLCMIEICNAISELIATWIDEKHSTAALNKQ